VSSDESPNLFSHLAKSLEGELTRSRETLVPAAFQFLWETPRFLVPYGGRASAKSWSIARVLLVLASESPLRVLCCREIQGSIKESAYRLLADQISTLQLEDAFEVQADCIIGKSGSRFYFEGLRYNASKIRSYESIDLTWVEEAQSVSEFSWETLLPTIRKPGSRFFISFNPMQPDDPVLMRFVKSARPDCVARKVSYKDNPFLSAEAEAERRWLEQTDHDSYLHVWEGEPRTISDAQILRGKYFIENFEVEPRWAGPFHGCDFGFSKDPSAGIRCFIDDDARVLYISHEFWQLACDIDRLPGALEEAIPQISRAIVHCDSSRPETVSYLQRHGIPGARSAEKWPGSVDDGVMYLRQFSKIIINPACVHTIDEARAYSFKCDRLTGQPLPQVEDKHNHCIDALRYALWPFIRSVPTNTYFNRMALMVDGQPAEIPECSAAVYGVFASSDRPGAPVSFMIFSSPPNDMEQRTILIDWDLAETDVAFTTEWLDRANQRLRECAREYRSLSDDIQFYCDKNDFGQAMGELSVDHYSKPHTWPVYIALIDPKDKELPAWTLDERASLVRAEINSGKVKLSRIAFEKQITHRASTTNHALAQILAYRPGAPEAPQELTAAFVLGISISRARESR
jgi:phage terminase large subunit